MVRMVLQVFLLHFNLFQKCVGRLQQMNNHVVISALKEHFALEIHQSLLASPDQHANQLIRNTSIGLEEMPKSDCHGAIMERSTQTVDDGAEFNDLRADMDARLFATQLGSGSNHRAAIVGVVLVAAQVLVMVAGEGNIGAVSLVACLLSRHTSRVYSLG